MTDDDKEPVEPDPWAGLEADANANGDGEAGGDDAAFIFDMLGDDAAAPEAAGDAAGGAAPGDEQVGGLSGDDPADDQFEFDALLTGEAPDAGIPLAVFPPPDAEPDHHDDLTPRPDVAEAYVAEVHGDARAEDEPTEAERPGIFAMDESADESVDGGLHDPASDDRGILAAASAGDDSAGDFLFATSQDSPAEFTDPPSEEV
jgi:hypothetical protein